MGADQSSSTVAQLKSQRDEDIPYTSYSISKPIDGDTPKASPRLASKSKSTTSRDAPQSRGEPSAQKHDIVVVAEGSSKKQEDTELQKLESIPVFLPLMRGSLNLPHLSQQQQQELESLDRLDTRAMLQLCQRYQDHLKQCAEAVAFDQNALCVRIKEVDFVIQTLYSNLTDRQKKFSKYAEQIQKVSEMATVLNKVKMNVEQTVPLMERLNSVLPPEEQLEPFLMKPAK